MDYQKTSLEISEHSGNNELLKTNHNKSSKKKSPSCRSLNATESVEEAINNFSVILPNLIIENTENGLSETIILSRTPSLNRKAHSSPIHEQRRHSDDGTNASDATNFNSRNSYSAHYVG